VRIITFILKNVPSSVTQRHQKLIIHSTYLDNKCTKIAIHKQVGLCRKEMKEKKCVYLVANTKMRLKELSTNVSEANSE